ncbi:MAG: hypothetical protein KatS3mg110_3279 [Pirellulaceae bacterium]|nr:MAG: hypothetical protein KatS3mg110_3279 [Pirellulaceae bacterium]
MSIDETLPAGPSPSGKPTSPVKCAAPPGYELIELIGQGGMGEVYRAVDVRLGREVAIKLLRPEYCDFPRAVERFRFEARITGRLQHPGIPAVHELGQMLDGRPFLAMKLVAGTTLKRLLDERPELSHDRGRFIAIFEQVCQAVGYAHAQGIIHRDLKPGNVMVGAFGEVQVMDWGIAKQLHSNAPAGEKIEPELESLATLLDETCAAPVAATQVGSVLGTPSYMAPEQARGEIDRLAPPSDVFALGAILCHILTGEPPVVGRTAEQVRRQVAAGELQEAYERLERCGAEAEWVELCRKCLAAEPSQRPSDGAAVAEAVARIRHAAEERARRAELARAEALVREKEQRKRRRVWIGLAVSLLVGLLISVGLGVRAELLRRQADQARRAEAEARQAEAEARMQAQKRLTQVEKSNQIITAIFADLDLRQVRDSGEPLEAVLAERLRTAARQLEGEAVGDPLVVATMQHRLAQSLVSLGYPQDAVELFEKAHQTRRTRLGENDPETLETASRLGMAYGQAGRLPEAIQLLEETLERRKEQLGNTDPATLVTMNDLAVLYTRAGRVAEAIPLLEQCYRLTADRLGVDHAESFVALSNLAAAYAADGTWELAIPLLEDYLQRIGEKLGPNHPYTLSMMNNLAEAYQQLGDFEQSIRLRADVVQRRRNTLGSRHPDTLVAMAGLASAYWATRRMDLAVEQLQETALLLEETGFRQTWASQVVQDLITALQTTGRYAEAESWARKWLDVVAGRTGKKSQPYAEALQALGDCLYYQKRYDDAASYYHQAMEIHDQFEPQAGRIRTLAALLSAELALGREQQADQYAKRLAEELAAVESRFSPDDQAAVHQTLDELWHRAKQLERADWLAIQLPAIKAFIDDPTQRQ